MQKFSKTLLVPVLLACSPWWAPSMASAAVTKTWVSSTGTDSGPCQLAAPCKTLQFAHDQTAAGGEIDVKDSGSYGAVTITKAISIVSAGVVAAIGAPAGGTGIAVKAGAQDAVVLDGLYIDGHGIGQTGIAFNTGRSLRVANCHIRNLTNEGISMQPVGAKNYSIADTEVANVVNFGIIVQPFNTSPVGTITHVSLHDNGTGLFVGYQTVAVIGSTISENKVGIGTEVSTNILLGGSTVAGNSQYGIQTEGGVVTSYGDNYINDNGTDISGSFGSISRR